MTNWGDLTKRIQKTNAEECEKLILTLASLSEITACNGFEILEKIHLGAFDEADLHHEEIPENYRKKVNLDCVRNDFFGDLIFAFQMMEDYDYTCELMENHIINTDCSDDEYRNMVFEYLGVRMICQKRLPWEIEYCLGSIVQRGDSLIQSMQNYMNEQDTYIDCVQRYRGHWERTQQ